MSDRTKLILAVTLGAVGLALGTLGTVVAFNAKNDVKSNQEITKVVEDKFAEAQKRQDALEAKQVTGAERLIRNLSTSERSLLRKINSNSRTIVNLRRRLNSQQQEIGSLKTTDQRLSGQITDLQRQVQRNFNELNDRIDRLAQRVDRLRANGR
jgi:chromosome segregation ATPase